MKKVTLSLLVMVSLVSGCYYDRFNELHPLDGYVNTCADSLTDNYTSVVKNVMALNCTACHNSSVSQGGVILTSYADVKRYATDGKLMGSIEHQSKYKAMPPNGSIRDCEIQRLKDWIATNMPE